VSSWFKQTLYAAKSGCFVKELLVEKYVKRLLATYLPTQINTEKVLAAYSANAVSTDVGVGKTKVERARDNYLTKGSKLEHIALSFEHDSRFWLRPPPPRNSVIKRIVT
jgi:hypothetical protein